MACSSNQSVSSSRMTWKYDVFVSFRGEDTRNNFTDHLFGAFHRKCIVAFKDDTKLKKGEHISSELLKAIEGSQILIVIFSRNYASSTGCLQELAKVADCLEVQGQTVAPVFYDASPSEVRKQSGDFEKSFMEHEERSKENLEEVQRWRRALTQVANLSGWDVKDMKAFKCDDIASGYTDLTNDVLVYANGLPLAIQVLGSFLYGQNVSEWRSALERLRENPRADIMDVLRVSFDGLEDTEKNIFLDVACFFDGESETYVKKVLDIRGFHPEIGLRVLYNKSFISCENRIIFMHDLLKELGKSIVREKSPKEPRKWNRMWDYKDVHNVMSENMETENLEAIVLQRYPYKIDEIQAMSTLRAESLAQMNRLKLLIMRHLNFSGSLNFLSSELGFLCWDKYPFTCLPSSFEPDIYMVLLLCD